MSVPSTIGEGFETGLEDFGMEDAVIPRLSIKHRDGVFVDSLSNEEFGTLNVIILGLVKQRVLWHPGMDDDDAKPMCRSTDHSFGYPNVSDKQPKEKRFPWDESGFDIADYPNDEETTTPLPCGSCVLKDWGSHPDGKRPYCSEQWTLPVLYDPQGGDNWVPAIITFQKTALKPLKAYLSSFARSRSAAFTAVTQMALDVMKRGMTEYSVPNFKRVGDTEQDDWREYSTTFSSMKEFLTAPPGSRDETEDSTPPAKVEAKPASKPAPKATPAAEPEDIVEGEVVEETPAPAAKAAPPAPAEDDDDLPF